MTPIAVATEDELSEAIALRLISELQQPVYLTHILRKGGFGYLRSMMDSWRQMAQQQIMLVLTDLDRANCVVEFRDQWLAGRPAPDSLLLRIAVREVEAWVLADHVAMSELLGRRVVFPVEPDALPDPKQTLMGLAKKASKAIRDDLIKIRDGQLSQGLGYNARLSHWVNTVWCPQRAAALSPSLARARSRLQSAALAFGT